MKNTALVTGASSGIGLELARYHASKGGDLVIVARRKEALDSLKNELEEKYGICVEAIVADLSNIASIDEIYQAVTQKGIVIDFLINNAGRGGQGYFHERELADELKMINLNVMSLVALTHKFLPEMVERNSGRILNVASSAAFVPGGPLQSIYFATKAFVLSFSQGLAGELDESGVTVTTLCPGATKTEFAESADLLKTRLFDRHLFSADKVAKDGYEAMLKGKLVQTSALSVTDRIGVGIIPLVPAKFVLKQIKGLQKIH